jgi:hypothetical protein
MGGDGRQAALTMQIKGDTSFIDGQTDGVQQRLPVAMADGLRWMALNKSVISHNSTLGLRQCPFLVYTIRPQ